MDIRLVGFAGLIGTALTCGTPADAAVLKVPQQYATIQAAVNAAQEADIVRVAAGTYAERVLISGKAIVLAGAGVKQTTIDAAQAGRPLTVSTTGPGQVTISGFTLKNGLVTWDDDINSIGLGQGGGVYAEYTNMTLSNNVIMNNLGCLGTSVAASEAAMTMTRNRIENNPGTPECGQQSVILRGPAAIVTGNVIQNHNVTGLQLQAAGKVTVSNNIFRNNVADFGLEHGALLSLYTELTLTNNLFAGNYGVAVGGAYVSESETGAPVHVSGNSFVGNSSFAGDGPNALWLASLSALEQTIVKNNQFDESADRLTVHCSFRAFVDASNVFVSGREAALGLGCAAAE
jgi:hypothetical protein